MEVDGANRLVVFGIVMLAGVVSKIFGAWVPRDFKNSAVDLVVNVKVSHFHAARTLTFYCTIDNTRSGFIVAMNGGGWLRVSKFFQG